MPCKKTGKFENHFRKSVSILFAIKRRGEEKMKVSASFLSSYNPALDLTKLNDTDVDYIHVDFMDGKFVSNKTMPFRQMKHIYEYTSKRLDVHLMVEKPMKWIPKFATLNTEFITIHIETSNVKESLDLIHSYAIRAGVCLKLETPIEELVPYLADIDYILLMGVEPGMGGQDFQEETITRLKELKKVLKQYKSKALIGIDGGINCENAKKLKQADMLVAGYYITSSDDFQKQIDTLRV